MTGYNSSTATVSNDGLYRYDLTRVWGSGGDLALFVMLNPSTADHRRDDPTIRRCVNYAKSWDCQGLVVVNLFAYRATLPSDLRRATAPVGRDNDRTIRYWSEEVSGPIVCAWGPHGRYLGRDAQVVELLYGRRIECLGLTKGGHPQHPLMMPNAATLRPFMPWMQGR